MRKTKDSAALKWIIRVCGSTLWWMTLLAVVRFLQGVSCIFYAYALGEVVNCAQYGLTEDFRSRLYWFIILVIITLILQSSGRYLHEKCKGILDKKFRTHTFSQLLQRDFTAVSRTHTGEWMNRIISDCNVVTGAVTTIVPELIGISVRMVGAFVALVQIVPEITLILVPGSLLLGIFATILRKWIKKLHKNTQQADGRARSFMQEQLSSLLVLRAFTQEKTAAEMATERMDTYIQVRMRRFQVINLSYTALSVIVNGAQVLGIGFCGWSILQGTMSYGTMSAILYLINLMESPLTNLSGYLSQYYSMLASAERLMEIETFAPDQEKVPESQTVVHQYYREKLASFGLENVRFAYADDKENIVLKDLSITVNKGEFVAFTGESGCGKSTAMKLFLAIYPLDDGCCFLEDTDGNRKTLDASWRGLFAYVPQGNQLISGTIREMLAFGDKTLMAQEDKMWSALEIACADGFVKKLPEGIDTMLGERGSGLSEGQMQRLSVARAILSGRPILLLDESTSALDASTEEQLLKNLRSMTDCTVLIITHREAALAVCNRQIHFGNR